MANQFNIYERTIAKKLETFPNFKLKVKKTYQYLNFWLSRKSYKFRASYDLHEISEGENETFFGYYDKSPVNETNEFLIYQSTKYSTLNPPNASVPIYVILFDLKNKCIINKYESKTYNWQQGTKLQWISTYEFIYNCLDQIDNYVSCLIDARNNNIKRFISFPIYDVYNYFGYSLNFDRLVTLRPDYGYRNHSHIKMDINNIENDGIYRIDLEKNIQELIIPLKTLIDLSPSYFIGKDKITHKINHIMISPNGERFIFLHRYFINHRRLDRLILSDKMGEKVVLLSDNEMISHSCWYGNDKIISYMRRYDKGDRYYIIDVNSLEIKTFGEGIIDKFGDGHPSIIKNRMVFDTYPDKSRMKSLYVYDIKENKLIFIGEFYESLKYYGETRCDLHPKWSFDGTKIFFESVHTGSRKLYYLSFL